MNGSCDMKRKWGNKNRTVEQSNKRKVTNRKSNFKMEGPGRER